MVFEGVNEFYDGSTLLQPLCHTFGLTIDKMNFVFCQIVAILIGLPFRHYFGPHRASAASRHLVEVVLGLCLAYFCFGRQVLHLVVQSSICLLLMRVVRPGVMEKAVLAFSMFYLCVCHVYRMVYDYEGYTLDITGPLMISTQRLSSLAFSLADGQAKEDKKLSPQTAQLAIRKYPSLLEFFSYIFSFHGLMCGPFCFYKDYISFIEGTNYVSGSPDAIQGAKSSANGELTGRSKQHDTHPPSPGVELLVRVLTAAVFGLSTVFLLPRFPSTLLTGEAFQEQSFIFKNILIVLVLSFERHKYYFAWKLGEAANLSSGLGFNGYDAVTGQAKWDLVENADILKIELATSPKVIFDNWNLSTVKWLKYVVHERWHSSLVVFTFSALWHGFYVGYYVAGVNGILVLNAARLLRRRLRPYFTSDRLPAFLCDVFTCLLTKLAISYVVASFILLSFWPSFYLFRGIYFCPQIVSFIAIVLLRSKSSQRSS